MGFTGYDDLLSLSRGFYLILHYLFSLCHSKTSRKILRLCTKERESPSPYPTNTKMIQVHFGPFRSKSRLAATRLHVRRISFSCSLISPIRFVNSSRSCNNTSNSVVFALKRAWSRVSDWMRP